MGGLFGDTQEQWSQRETQRQDTFEDAVVAQLLRTGGLGAQIGRLRQESSEVQRGAKLTLPWFNQRFPRFPVRLGARKLANIHKVQLGELFGPGFMKTPMMRAYVDLQVDMDASDADERIGLVFAWPHIPTAGTMVLHNYPIEVAEVPDPSLRYERNTRIVRPYGNPPVVYVIDPLKEFLFSIGTDWAEL
jgi:hypothetical protein